MVFSAVERNQFWKLASLQETIDRISASLQKADIHPVIQKKTKVCNHLFWCGISEDFLGLRANGKGVSEAAAFASALAELTERFSFPFQWNNHFHFDTFFEYTRDLLDYRWLKGYSYEEYSDIEKKPDSQPGAARRHEPALRLDIGELIEKQVKVHKDRLHRAILKTDLVKHWVDAYSLRSQKKIRIPIKFVEWFSSSNGLAAGNTLEEAVIQATHELFERHAALETVYKPRKVPTIDVQSIKSKKVHEIIDFLKAHNQELFFKDLSLGGKLPVTGLMIVNHSLPADNMEHRLLFYGSSFYSEERLLRCLTESMQGRIIDHGNCSILPRPMFNRKINGSALDHTSMFGYGATHDDLSFLEKGDSTEAFHWPVRNLKDEFNVINKICDKFDTDWIMLDMTNPVINFPVVRVILPGLLNRISCFMNPAPILKREKIAKSFFSEE